MNDRLFLTGQTIEELRAKFRAPSPALEPLWRHFLLLARHNPFWCSSYSILAFLVTGEDVYRKLARDVFIQFTATEKAALLSWDVQLNTHTASAPVGRLMAFYDWIADTDLLAPSEKEAFEAAALDFAHLIPMDQLQGRARSFDNQVLSNCFGAAMTGHILGVKRGDSALARRLYAISTDMLLDQFRRLPRSCYSGEGSTYHEQVVGPMLLLSGLFLEEVMGVPLYDRGVEPANVSLREWYAMSVDMVGPEGLLPAWDAGGARASVKAPLVYRARRERTPEPLALIRDAGLWYPLNNAAWEMDDRLWTMVWWPDDLPVPGATSFLPWMNPGTAGALQSGATRTRLFQYWDECGGAPYNGRPNVNPNAIILESAGLPLLLDGGPGLAAEHLRVTPEQVLQYVDREVLVTLLKYWSQEPTDENVRKAALHAVSGSVGESNSLVIDRENWYVPLHPVAGRGRALHAAGGLQVIESEAAAYYTDRYDAIRVDRMSALVGGRYVVTVDDTAFRSPHTLTWQVFTWPGARLEGRRVVAEAGGEVRLDIIPGADGTAELTPIAGFPSYPRQGSTRVEIALPAPVAQARLPVCLVPQPLLTPVLDVTRGWSLHADGRRLAGDVDLETYYLTDDVEPGSTLTFRRSIRLDDAVARRGTVLRLRLAVPNVRLAVNGRPVAERYEQYPMFLQGQTPAFPHLYDIGDSLQPGENELTLALEGWHGESLKGPVTLLAPCEPARPEFTALSDVEFAVTVAGKTDHLLLGNMAGEVEWQGGRTDARHALLDAGGELALAGVLRATFPALDMELEASQPVDVAVAEGRIELGELPPNANLWIRLGGTRLQVSAITVVQVAWDTDRPVQLVLRSASARVMFFNGESAGRRGGAGEPLIHVTLAPHAARTVRQPRTADEVYRVGEQLGSEVEGMILEALVSNDWRIQLAAADVAGRLRLKKAVPVLLLLFEREDERQTYPPLKHSWARSKMKEALFAGEDHSHDLGTDPVVGVKRHRLKRMVVTALGLLGDRVAIPLLERAMARGTDFFPALSQVPVALARLDSTGSIPILEKNRDFFEWNTRAHVRLALRYLKREIDRAAFERLVNPT